MINIFTIVIMMMIIIIIIIIIIQFLKIQFNMSKKCSTYLKSSALLQNTIIIIIMMMIIITIFEKLCQLLAWLV